MRSMKGNANWQTGQLTLKKASSTGPEASAWRSLNSCPSSAVRVKSGARTPSASAGMRSLLRDKKNHFILIEPRLFEHAGATQGLAGEAREGKLGQAGEGDPLQRSLAAIGDGGEVADSCTSSVRGGDHDRDVVGRLHDGVA